MYPGATALILLLAIVMVPLRPQPSALIVNKGLLQNVVFISQAHPSVIFAWPMQRMQPYSPAITVLGSDEGNCSIKDATGFRVLPNPTAGYVEFPFTTPVSATFTTGWFVF